MATGAQSHLRPRLQVLGAAALFSTGAAAIKATALSHWQVAGFRSGVAALTLILVLWYRGELRVLTRLRRAPAVGVAYALALVAFAVANKLTTAANTIFLVSTAPLWVALLSPWLLDERPSRRDLGPLALVALGMAVVFAAPTGAVETAPDPARGNQVAVLSAVFWALTLIGLRRLGHGAGLGERGEPAAAMAGVVWGNALAFILTLPLALPVTRWEVVDGLAIGYLGVVQIGIAYLLLVAGIARVTAVEVALLLLLEPVLNPVWAWIAHREVPAPAALAGGAVILGALALRLWLGVRRPPAGAAGSAG